MGEGLKGDNFGGTPRLVGVFGSDDDAGSGFKGFFIADVDAERPIIVMGTETPCCGACDHAS